MNNINGLGSQRSSSGGGGGGSPPQADCKSSIMKMWAGIPFFNRFIVTSCVSLYLVSFILPSVLYYLVMMPIFMESFQSKYLFIYFLVKPM